MNTTLFIRSLVLAGLIALAVTPAVIRIESTVTAESAAEDQVAPDRLAQRCFTRNGRTVCF